MKRKTKTRITATPDTAKIYQRIGEFVVCFQWIEDRFRQIGWLILDPTRKERSPMSLRNLNNEKLIKRVESLFVDLVGRLDVQDREDRIQDFKAIVAGLQDVPQQTIALCLH